LWSLSLVYLPGSVHMHRFCASTLHDLSLTCLFLLTLCSEYLLTAYYCNGWSHRMWFKRSLYAKWVPTHILEHSYSLFMSWKISIYYDVFSCYVNCMHCLYVVQKPHNLQEYYSLVVFVL
jgi:hypothetical protein